MRLVRAILICEIQQNSNSTYRMYDYDRRDKFGNPRELHVAKALDVVDTKAYVKDENCEVILEKNDAYTLERLVQCKYFECLKYDIYSEVKSAWMKHLSCLFYLFPVREPLKRMTAIRRCRTRQAKASLSALASVRL